MREDFFLARSFRDLDDLNAQFAQWLDQVANRRLHGTTGRIVAEHFTEERPSLKPLPAGPFNAVLRLERRISRDGMVSIGGNLYSVPDGTRRRPVEVQLTAAEVNILEEGRLIAAHPVLDGRGKRRIAEGHRSTPVPRAGAAPPPLAEAGVTPRSLAIYEAIGRRLANAEPAR